MNDLHNAIFFTFRVFDKASSGVITVNDFRHIMTNLGEKLTDEDVDDMLDYVTYNDRGDIKYRGKYPKRHIQGEGL